MCIRNIDLLKFQDLQTQLNAEKCELKYPRQIPLNSSEKVLLQSAVALEAMGSNPPVGWWKGISDP